MTTGLAACGGGGGDDTGGTVVPPTPVNNAPTISEFNGEVSNNSPLEVTFSWSVADTDNDALACVLSLGNSQVNVEIADCKATQSATITYQAFGPYTANLAVSDPSNASSNTNFSVDLVDEFALPEPEVIAGDNQLVIFYNRPDAIYDGWILHLWNNEECNAYADFANDAGTDWATGQSQSGLDANYGAYWLIDLKPELASCANFIVHKGDDKDIGGIDHKADLTGDRMFWTLSGISDLFSEATLYPKGVLIADTAAHWATLDTVFWDVLVNTTAKIRVYSADVDDLGYDGETGISGDNFIEFMPVANSANTLGMPRYNALNTFEASNPDLAKAKNMLTGKLLAIAYNSDNGVVAATYVQTPRVLDALYTTGSTDADEAELGLQYTATDITASVWAPTAQQVSLNIYNSSKVLQSTETMVVDSTTGVWSFTTPIANDRVFYRYELTLYHQQNQQFEKIWSTDPYSVSLSTNGLYSQFVNLTDADLKPADWDAHTIPVITDIEDAIIYEGNIRDFSIRDESTSLANRGKYLAFTEENSEPVTHLKALTTAGLTHFQILPANDIASVEEDFSKQINLASTVAQLCAVKSNAPVCDVENMAATLLSVFKSYDASTNQAKILTETIRDIDGYNFGYDPKHFNAPDGSFASDADGVSRILEMRAMNKALHDIGLRASLDVVYNHTNSSGLWDNSVLDKVVPGYYYRRDLTTGNVMNETCCQDTETEHRMMDKLMSDSLVMWATQYKFDAFRFDIMGSHSKRSIVSALAAVKAVDSDTYFYGEGWGRSEQGYEQAGQNQMAGTEVGTFNDRPRDIIRGASLFNNSGSLNDQDIMRLGLSGTLQDYQLQDKTGAIKSGKDFSQSSYAKDPADIINYVSKHDGSTLWDKLQYGLASDMSVDARVRAQNIAITMPILSQGIPFLQIGGDLLRSKSMDKNSYNNGDWYNLVDFTQNTNNWNVGLPLEIEDGKTVDDVKAIIANAETTVQANHINFASQVFNEFVAIRASSKLFRLTSAQDVYDRVGFHNTGTSQTKGLLVMSIDDGTGNSPELADIDTNHDAIVVVINGTTSEQSHTVPTATGFELHSVQKTSVDSTVQTASFTVGASSGTFTVPALTTAVFVKPQGVAQGSGLSAGATRDAPDIAPYGNNAIYVRGSMNNDGAEGFSDTDTFTYEGNGLYSLDTSLTVGIQSFTITSINSTAVNLGFSDVSIDASSLAVTNNNGSIGFTVDADGNFSFMLDASSATPVLTISSVSPTVDCTALPDSNDAIPFTIAGDGQLYVKGDHASWNAEEAYRLHYKGNNVYQAVADFDGAMQFKLASSDGNWETQLWAQAEGSTEINDADLALGVTYPVAYNGAGTDNNKTTLAAGSYSFLLTLNEADPSQGANVGSMIIQQCQP